MTHEPPVRLRACAKVNLALDVLGRRDDGYHDLVSVMQTVALWDDLELASADADALTVLAPAGWDVSAGRDNLTLRAVDAYRERAGIPTLHVAIRLRKRVPPAGGLGGGSSDAAAVLRGLERLTGGAVGMACLAEVAAALGSDVPFFLRGGTQLTEGRGERLTPLPDLPARRLVLVTPALSLERKTARLFGMLRPADFTDGRDAYALAEAIRRHADVRPEMLVNTFDRVAGAAFPTLDQIRHALMDVCGHAVLSGAGPSLFALAADEHAARAAVADLSARGVPALAVGTLDADESTLIE